MLGSGIETSTASTRGLELDVLEFGLMSCKLPFLVSTFSPSSLLLQLTYLPFMMRETRRIAFKINFVTLKVSKPRERTPALRNLGPEGKLPRIFLVDSFSVCELINLEVTPHIKRQKMKQEEDTATYESDDSQYSYQEEIKMPPLKYARIVGCLPRSSDVEAAPGSSQTGAGAGGSSKTGPITDCISCSTIGQATIPSTSTSYTILATGHTNGSIRLLTPQGESVFFGSTLQDGGIWYINPKKKSPVKDVCFDSGCGSFAAVDTDGDVGIFAPLLWGAREVESKGLLSSTTATNADEKPGRQLSQIVLQKPPLSTLRFNYDTSPSCLLLDPAYSRKNKQLVAGFTDGRLILSKLQISSSGITSFFGSGVKKIDTTIYQGMHPIQTIAWRGSLIAWADESGVRLFDVTTMSRIAHVDRPTGARANLYPTINELRPCLVFERSDRLLIGWGDCLMGMRVYDAPNTATKEKKKVVECIMAWELDCVACGVVPVDEVHVGVLGLVPHSTDVDADENIGDEEYFGTAPNRVAGGDNILELQIINREDGKSISNDRIPMLQGNSSIASTVIKPNVADFRLLTSYATQRMEDLAEWDALNDGEKETIRNEVDMSEFMSNQTFPDAHMRWRMDNDVCTIEFGNEDITPAEVSYSDEQSTSSNDSALSDDYVFALSQPMEDILADTIMPLRSHPPSMVIMYKHDACLVQTRDADDAISYARSLGKPALALKTALAHRRDVRRHGIDLLVDEYFLALLRMNNSGAALSLSRLQIAAQSMPILLGGDVRMWQRWIFMFARVCGGLFTIREKIPVRDPWLAPFVFEMVLEKMLEETCSNAAKPEESAEQIHQSVGDKMSDLFLETLRAWGPTASLRRRIQMHRFFIQSHNLGPKWRTTSVGSNLTAFIQQAERDLQRRITQTAFGVLVDAQSSDSHEAHPSLRQHISSSDDSLYSVDSMLLKFTAKIFTNDNDEARDIDFGASIVKIRNTGKEAVIVLESLAELELMRERHDRSLGYYLAIGSMFIGDLSEIEAAAVESVNSYHRSIELSLTSSNTVPPKFGHVLSLIEMHQLHHFLLHQNYSFDNHENDSEVCTPIVSLIKLVGLKRAGAFLKESCSPPDGVLSAADRSVSFASLPLDLVANQLKSRPKLLYWYLFLLFAHKAEMYVKFATTAVPPLVITELHRTQFFLFVDYADVKVSPETDITPSFLDVDEETSFMSFLVAALPHGGIRPDSVIDALEKHRDGKISSEVYARELAFVIEKFGGGDFEDAKKVLQIYLLGAQNLFLAVAYAERNTKYSSELWEMLITHCTEAEGHGALFGSLLEAAAHCGADLSSLVAKIPEGVAIEGLRPKLIAAVSDYRYKVKIHEFESNILTDDKVSIIRELSHLSRRGSRNISQRTIGNSAASEQKQSAHHLKSQRNKMNAISIPSHLSGSLSLAIR